MPSSGPSPGPASARKSRPCCRIKAKPAVKLLYIFPEEFTGRFAREYHVYRLAESMAAAGCDVTLAAAPSSRLSNAEQLHELFGGSRSERLNVVWLKRQVSLGPWKIRS